MYDYSIDKVRNPYFRVTRVSCEALISKVYLFEINNTLSPANQKVTLILPEIKGHRAPKLISR